MTYLQCTNRKSTESFLKILDWLWIRVMYISTHSHQRKVKLLVILSATHYNLFIKAFSFKHISNSLIASWVHLLTFPPNSIKIPLKKPSQPSINRTLWIRILTHVKYYDSVLMYRWLGSLPKLLIEGHYEDQDYR